MSTDLREQLQAALGSAYTVERELGRGGMSRVFVATEMAFGRKVVAKVLHPDLSEGVSVERFKREISVAAKLQHPHIVQLLSAGETGGVLYYTMPFVEGESLRQRLEREIELPIPDVVRTLREIASALAYAHRHGLVHRDIKPDNVLFSDGTAVVTDFGIAKAITAARTHGDVHAGTLTQLGTSLGTPAYMAPEQVTGEPNVDHRADLYALGCVAFELLAGRPPFVGRNAQALMAAHATEQPDDIGRLRPSTPPALATLVMQCLEKRPADRPQNAEEITRALESMIITPVANATFASRTAAAVLQSSGRRLAAGAALLVLGVAFGVALFRVSGPLASDAPVRRWSITLPDTAPMAYVGSALFGIGRPALAVSPDGSMLVYVARVGKTTMLYSRRLAEFDCHPVAGTEGAFMPFFSPDGKWIAFFTGTELKKVSLDGGRPFTLAQVVEPLSGAWTADGRIYVVGDMGRLREVSEAGGITRILDVLIAGSTTAGMLPHKWLLGAPARRLTLTQIDRAERFQITASGLVAPERVPPNAGILGSGARSVASGHLVYVASGEDGALMALPFDASTRRVLGAPKLVLQGIRQESGEFGVAQFAVSDEGTLVYAPGRNAKRSLLVIRDRRGKVDTLPFPRSDYGEPRVSPKGRRATIVLWPPASPAELHIIDLTRGTRVTFRPDQHVRRSQWWPDGNSLIVSTTAPTGLGAALRISATTGEILDTLFRNVMVEAVSLDSSRYVVVRVDEKGTWLVWRDTTRGQPVRIATDPGFTSFSPDGQWVAHTTRTSGRSEIEVIRAADPSERYRVTRDGGEEAIWSVNGEEIVYRNHQRWYSVRVSTRNGFSYEQPRLLFEGPYANVPGWSHGLMPDGRHLLLQTPPEETTTQLNVVTNWFAELKRLAPATQR